MFLSSFFFFLKIPLESFCLHIRSESPLNSKMLLFFKVLRGPGLWFLLCQETTMCTDLAACILSASPSSFPTAMLGGPSPWGNRWINVTQCSSCSRTLHRIFLETAAQIAVIRLESLSHMTRIREKSSQMWLMFRGTVIYPSQAEDFELTVNCWGTRGAWFELKLNQYHLCKIRSLSFISSCRAWLMLDFW